MADLRTAWRSSLAFDADTATFGYGAYDLSKREFIRQFAIDHNFTVLTIMLSSGGYDNANYGKFWLWDEPTRCEDMLAEINAAGLAVHLWTADTYTLARCGASPIPMWEHRLPPLAKYIQAVSVGPECNDFCTPQQQRDYPRALKRILPSALNLMTLTDKRSHAAHQLSNHPQGPFPPEWRAHRDENGLLTVSFERYWEAEEDVLDGLAYQSGIEDCREAIERGNRTPLREDLGDVSIRVTGTFVPFVKDVGYRGRFKKLLIAHEGPAEDVLSGRYTFAQARVHSEVAMTVPGVAGSGD